MLRARVCADAGAPSDGAEQSYRIEAGRALPDPAWLCISLTAAVALSQSAAVLWVRRWRQCVTRTKAVLASATCTQKNLAPHACTRTCACACACNSPRFLPKSCPRVSAGSAPAKLSRLVYDVADHASIRIPKPLPGGKGLAPSLTPRVCVSLLAGRPRGKSCKTTWVPTRSRSGSTTG